MSSNANPLYVRVEVEVSCVDWLKTNGYGDIAATIETLQREWKEADNGTRRDWWLILAGTPLGEQRKVNDIPFPILKSARRRQGFPPNVPGALERGLHELAPAIERQARWGPGFKRALK